MFESHADWLNDELFDKYSFPYIKKINDEVKLRLDKLNIPKVPMVINSFIKHYSITLLK